jgi:hypothetical protein
MTTSSGRTGSARCSWWIDGADRRKGENLTLGLLLFVAILFSL